MPGSMGGMAGSQMPGSYQQMQRLPMTPDYNVNLVGARCLEYYNVMLLKLQSFIMRPFNMGTEFATKKYLALIDERDNYSGNRDSLLCLMRIH